MTSFYHTLFTVFYNLLFSFFVVEQQAREYHKHRLERALGGLEHRAMAEVDKTKVRNDAMLDAEARMNTRFQQMVTELRESWSQEESAREFSKIEKIMKNVLKLCSSIIEL